MSEDFSYKFFSTTKEAWQAMHEAILASQKSIYWEVYCLIDDVDGERFIATLCEKALAGVEVKLILDAVGSLALSHKAEVRLKSAKVDLLWFNPLSPWRMWRGWFDRLWRRDHRKVLVIDNEVAFIGGVNVESTAAEWDDLHLRLTGRVVRTLLRDFAKSYVKCGGLKNNVKHLLHPKREILSEWGKHIRFIMHSPSRASSHWLRKFYAEALMTAKESVTLVTPYYIPDRQFLKLVAQASARGVKVSILLPERTDVKLIHWLAQMYYDVTEKAGAKIYFSKKMNHGKVLAVDNKSVLLGSVNMTRRSFELDQEASVYFTDETMIKELNGILDNWKNNANPSAPHRYKWNVPHRFRRWWVEKVRKWI